MSTRRSPPAGRPLLRGSCLVAVCALLTGCWPGPYEWRHENQWDSREQIGMAEASQVKLRMAQSRLFETTDTRRILAAVLAVMQDLNFSVQVLDEELGIVSGKLLVPNERPEFGAGQLSTYNNYNDHSLLLFTRNFRDWGPFWHRDDLVRLTVTVRRRNAQQSVVRASVQFYLQAVENPEPYRKFFDTLEKALLLDAQTVQNGEERS